MPEIRDLLATFPIEPHHEIAETFVDTLGLSFTDGQPVRIELAVSRMKEPKPPAKPTGHRHISARLVMTVPCAVDLFNQLQQIMGGLAQQGTVQMDKGTAKPTQKPN
jgi:hypothetical protein